MYGYTDDVILINAYMQIYEYVVCRFSGVQVVSRELASSSWISNNLHACIYQTHIFWEISSNTDNLALQPFSCR
jgi:hypothetical protein